ncbi:unnamed protein product [Lymnaea stagnalis]|uniref:SOCS box domain-containing protein n=1 Tax=Lymnaea stagnalis TaxID=6523 RepID=A0AAV2HWM6_LYMST
MEQIEVLSRPSGSHVAMDAGLDLIALSRLLRISLTGNGRSRETISGADSNWGVAEKGMGTELFDLETLPSGHTITDTGATASFDIHPETDLPGTEPGSVHTIAAASREAVRNGAVNVIASLLPLVKKLIATNDSVTGAGDYMDELVAEAIDRRQCAVLRLLLNNGADPGGAYRNKSHLIRAVTADDPELTKDLLHFGADVNVHEVNSKTALHVASAHSSRDVMELLVDQGCRLEARDGIQGSTPLHVACTYCNRDAVLVLVEKGAEFNAVSDFGDTPLAKLLGPVTKAKDFHSEARLRLAEELVGLEFVLPPRSISKRISSDRPVMNVTNVRTNKKSSSKKGRKQEKYKAPNDSQPPLPEPLQHSDTDTTVGSCSYPTKRENMHRIFDRLLKNVSGSLSLKQLCRLTILHALGHVPLKSSVPTLGLPNIVQNYIISGEKAVEARMFIEA